MLIEMISMNDIAYVRQLLFRCPELIPIGQWPQATGLATVTMHVAVVSPTVRRVAVVKEMRLMIQRLCLRLDQTQEETRKSMLGHPECSQMD